MKIPDIPIGNAHAKDSIRYFNWFHCSLLFKKLVFFHYIWPNTLPYPFRHPPQTFMPSSGLNLEAMVGSPQRSQDIEGSIRALGGKSS
jgi:hypothetical protein